jgi:hypothetical protein
MGENLLEPSTIPRCLPAAPAPTPAVDARLERYQRRHGGASGAQPLPTDARRLPFSFALSPDLSGGPTTTEARRAPPLFACELCCRVGVVGRGSSTAHRALGDWRLQVSAQIAPAAAEQPNGRTAVQADLQSQSLAVKPEPGSPLFSPNLLAQLSS